ncbi:hypothetical protein [Microbulbifer sp. ANSA005]|uniref:hypothetical protein n=1 Tax=Microbulbifer sp. ANSA005 TaxID=3243362 RepID=UPI00404177DA
MEIPNTWAPMLVSSVRDAVLYQENLLNSETLRDREDYEEHLLQLTQFLEFIKSEYKSIESETGIPLDKLL